MCPAKYDLHYNKKLRSTSTSSPLVFGGALDAALNVLLLTKKKNLTIDEQKELNLCPYEVFDKNFRYIRLNGQDIDIKYSDVVDYFKSDFDETLLTEEDKIEWKEKPNINLTWLSLRRKGHLMVTAYKEQILPQIREVLSIQRKVSIKNQENDEFEGFIDFEATFKDYEGIYTTDNKSSSRAYSEDSVKESVQLTIYDEETGNGKGAYAVILKKLYKKDPKIRTQLILDDINQSKKDLIFDEIDDILHKIRQKQFPKIMENNNCFQFGRKCIYFDYCRNGSMKGLINRNKK